MFVSNISCMDCFSLKGQSRETGRARARRGRAMHFQISDDGAAPRAAELVPKSSSISSGFSKRCEIQWTIPRLELDAMYDFSHFSPNVFISDECRSHVDCLPS